MFRRPDFVRDPDVQEPDQDLGDLIEKASEDARIHRVVGQVLQAAVHRTTVPRPAPVQGFQSLAPDPVAAVTPPQAPPVLLTPPVPLAPADYTPPPATFITWGPAVGHPGYVSFTARGTYGAREYLKRLGGRWDVERKRWLVPKHHAERAAAIIEQAELGKLPNADPGYRPGQSSLPAFGLACWVCGMSYPPIEFRARPGARAEDYYCGCADGAGKSGARRFRR